MVSRSIEILLVEDSPDDAHFLQEALSEAGADPFRLTHVVRLDEALAFVEKNVGENPIDVILLDLSLPDSQGYDTFVRTHTEASDIPIIVLTGLDDQDLALQAVQTGAQDYLVKGGVDGNSLVRAIRYAMERKRAEEAVQEIEKVRVLAETAGAAAHEISQPLTVIIGQMDLIFQRMDIEPDLRSRLEAIQEAGQRIRSIIDQMRYPEQYVTKNYMPGFDNQVVDFDASAGKSSRDK